MVILTTMEKLTRSLEHGYTRHDWSSSFLLLLIWDVPSLLEKTGNSLAQGPADVLMAMWHLARLLLGLRAIAFMYLMKRTHDCTIA